MERKREKEKERERERETEKERERERERKRGREGEREARERQQVTSPSTWTVYKDRHWAVVCFGTKIAGQVQISDLILAICS